jgi:hypothetical protein
MKRHLEKFVIDIFFTPYTVICGSILNGYPEFIDTMETRATSLRRAVSNVRYRFMRDGRTNGHPMNQFQFIPREVEL